MATTDSLLEINTNMNKEMSHFANSSHNRSTVDQYNAAAAQLSSTPKLMHYDHSAVPSPFLDKKLQLQANTPQLKPRALSPANSEEHQYDIPFSHLKRSQQELETRQQIMQQQQHPRKSRTSNTRTSSGTSHGKFAPFYVTTLRKTITPFFKLSRLRLKMAKVP